MDDSSSESFYPSSSEYVDAPALFALKATEPNTQFAAIADICQ
jgi:hypothetical protein